MNQTIKAEIRNTATRSELKQLRNQGLVPASVSGKKISPISLAIEEKQLMQLMRGHSHEIVDLDITGQGKQSVIMKEVQHDKLNTAKVLHVEFQQVSMDEPIKTMVPIEFSGEPVGVKEGGLLQQIVTEVEVRALPAQLPGAIQVDVSELRVGDKLTVGEMNFPQGVECMTDLDVAIVTVLHVQQPSDAQEEEMKAEAEGKGGIAENSGAKLSDRPSADEALEERAHS